MHQTRSSVGEHALLPRGPGGEGVRPLLRPPDVEPLHAARHDGAVSEAGYLSSHATGDDVHHDFVVGVSSLRIPTQHGQTPAAAETGQDEAVQIVVFSGYPRALLEDRQCRHGVATEHQRDRLALTQATAETRSGIIRYQPPHAGCPACCLRDVATQVEVKADPEPALGRALDQATLQIGVVRSFAQSHDFGVATDEKGRDCQAFQILRRQVTRRMGSRQSRVLGRPVRHAASVGPGNPRCLPPDAAQSRVDTAPED